MEKLHKVLFVDDDKRYAAPLIDRAYANYNIELDHFDNWEEALSKLDEDFDAYQAVIIDGKGKKTKDDKGDDISHVVLAIKDLSERKGKGQYIPYIVLSKYLEIKDIMVDEVFFEKGVGEDKMFKFLISSIENSEANKIRSKYKEAYLAFGDHYLNVEAERNLTEVLLAFEKDTWSANSFNPMRKIVESVYQSLHEYDDNLIPYECLRFENGYVNFKFCELRLTGREIRKQNSAIILFTSIPQVLSNHIGWFIGPLTTVCSKASHKDYEDKLTKYTLGTIVNAVIDILIWYKEFIDRNYK